MDEIDDARRTSFDRAAELYDRARPSYPDALIEHIAARVPGRRVVEIGAGTGKATEVYARHGYDVVALEPGANLAAVLRGKQLPGVRVVETTFEAWTPDQTYDLVTAAQAIHWIDPAQRYTRTAEVARAIAVIRNEIDWPAFGPRADFDAAYARFMDPGEPKTIDAVCGAYVADIAASGRWTTVSATRFPSPQRYTTDAYLQLLRTYSNHALLPAERQRGLFDAIAEAIERRGGAIEIPYLALLFLATRS